MSERTKEKIGVYKEIFKSLFALMALAGGASFSSLSKGKASLWTLMGTVFTIWLAIALVYLWRYMIDLIEEIDDE